MARPALTLALVLGLGAALAPIVIALAALDAALAALHRDWKRVHEVPGIVGACATDWLGEIARLSSDIRSAWIGEAA